MDGIFTIFSLLVVLMMFLIPVGFVGGIIYLIVRAVKKGQQRVKDIQQFAAQSGWQFVGKTPLASLRGAEHFYLFSLGGRKNVLHDEFTIKIGKFEYRRIENLIYGAAGGFQVSIFDYIYTNDHGKNSKSYYQTVVMLESIALNLPLFTMRPEGKLSQIGQWFGGQDIDFGSHPVFSEKYLLRGQNEPHIRHIFNPNALSFLEKFDNFSIEGGGRRLFTYREKVLIEPSQFQKILDEAMQTAHLLAGANAADAGRLNQPNAT